MEDLCGKLLLDFPAVVENVSEINDCFSCEFDGVFDDDGKGRRVNVCALDIPIEMSPPLRGWWQGHWAGQGEGCYGFLCAVDDGSIFNRDGHAVCGSLAAIEQLGIAHHKSWVGDRWIILNESRPVIDVEVGFRLLNADLPRHSNSIPGRFIGLKRQQESSDKQYRADPDQYCRPESVLGHPLGRPVHGLCGRVHTLLGSKISYLPLAGFFFAALAGLGLGLILDNVNRKRHRKHMGWLLLLLGLSLSLTAFLLGLP